MDTGPDPFRAPARRDRAGVVTAEDVLALAAAGARLVETLGPAFYADAHLPGAVNVPHDRVDELAPRLLPDREAVVVVYGSDPACHNCGFVAGRLRRLGYRDVRSYPGGKQGWILAGLPVEHGAPGEPARGDGPAGAGGDRTATGP